jgi:peptide deformylase
MGEEREELAYLINPRIVKTEGKTMNEEGCLSIPGVFAKVERFKKIIVEGQDFYGEPTLKETEVFSSVIIQHESDHLVGKLFVDRLSLIKRKLLLAKYSRQ